MSIAGHFPKLVEVWNPEQKSFYPAHLLDIDEATGMSVVQVVGACLQKIPLNHLRPCQPSDTDAAMQYCDGETVEVRFDLEGQGPSWWEGRITGARITDDPPSHLVTFDDAEYTNTFSTQIIRKAAGVPRMTLKKIVLPILHEVAVYADISKLDSCGRLFCLRLAKDCNGGGNFVTVIGCPEDVEPDSLTFRLLQLCFRTPPNDHYMDHVSRRRQRWPRCLDGVPCTCCEVVQHIMRSCHYISLARAFSLRWLQQMATGQKVQLATVSTIPIGIARERVATAARPRTRCNEVASVCWQLSTDFKAFGSSGDRFSRSKVILARVYSGFAKRVEISRSEILGIVQAAKDRLFEKHPWAEGDNEYYNGFSEAVSIGSIKMIKDYMVVTPDIAKWSCPYASECGDHTTLLHYAAEAGDINRARLLLCAGADVNDWSDSRHTQNPRRGGCPLHCAAMNGHLEMVQLFIGAGADVHIKDRGDGSALHSAFEWYSAEHRSFCKSSQRFLQIVKILVNAGADVNMVDRYLESGFLELALQWNFVELVDVLMQAGAHLKKIDDT